MDGSEEYVDDVEAAEDSENDDAPQPKKKKAGESTKKAFQHKWLELNQFKGWLESVPSNKFAAKCRCCGMMLNCGKSELDRHSKTAKHLKNVKSFALAPPADQVLLRKSATQMHDEDVKSYEVQLSAFFAEHNTAFLQADHLVRVMKKGVKDSAIVKDMTLGHQKCTAIIQNVLAKVETEELETVLKDTLFSVMIDESTDVGDKKNMCILVRYVSPTSRRVVTQLLELVQIDAHDSGAEALWKEFTECLDRHEVPLTNVVGLACDNAAVMTGVRASFWTKLKEACPWAILMNCICHTSALVSKHACSELPSFVESHLRSISTYISSSPKRCAQLVDFQELYEEELQKVLRFSNTRWLVMHSCVQRYITHRESLLGYFRTTARDDPKDKEAAIILQDMNNPFTLAYMYFLEYVLDYFNQFNALFQSRDILIHKLSESSRKLLKKFCQNFIGPGHLNNLADLNLRHPSNFLPLENMYVGPKCSQYLTALKLPSVVDSSGRKKSEEDQRKELKHLKGSFLQKCLAFYIRAAVEMQARLPLASIFAEMSFLDPAILLSSEARQEQLPDLTLLAANFQERLQIDVNALAVEWRTIPSEIDGPLRKKLLEMSVEEVWSEIHSLKNFSGERVFPELSKLANCVLTLPHSNAEAERIFSIVTDVKTKKRNRMGAGSLNAVAVVRSSFASKNVTCDTFNVTEAHLKKFNKDMYK